ncbi:hypothetical protein GRX03_14410 [Halovenus sp. WSH3]|uniref:UPF0146 protein GRX03_14410 n=1 Tax=Halovenus carboxidivorans TaxID=2692199 RepID=A0A6B0TAZ8_9EURY|nr:hypothetical protein [Halovenus carboxidivorans]
MRTETVDAIADRLAGYDRVVEVAVGTRTAVARELAGRGVAVTATDVVDRETPEGVRFARDDLTAPTLSVYEGADCLFAQNLPPELHKPTVRLAARVDADCLFTTLGGDPPLVEVSRETIPGETLFVVRANGGR